MPTYEYKCEACGHGFEQFQSITAPAVKKCPECGKNKVRRLIGTGAGLIFKGSGFYITDYRSDGYKSAAKSDSSGGNGDGGGGGETKSGAKPAGAGASAPAAKPESKPAASPAASTSSSGDGGGAKPKKS